MDVTPSPSDLYVLPTTNEGNAENMYEFFNSWNRSAAPTEVCRLEKKTKWK